MRIYQSQGFTLIELITVIVIISILVAMSTQLITLPVNSYLNIKRRTTLVDTADMSLRRMQRDIRRALPNSIRITTVSNGVLLELLHTLDGGRYRADADMSITVPTQTTCTKNSFAPNLIDDTLDFGSPPDLCFEIMGNLTSFDPTAPHNEFLYIYNASTDPQSAYVPISDPKSNRRQVIKATPIISSFLRLRLYCPFLMNPLSSYLPLSIPPSPIIVIWLINSYYAMTIMTSHQPPLFQMLPANYKPIS